MRDRGCRASRPGPDATRRSPTSQVIATPTRRR